MPPLVLTKAPKARMMTTLTWTTTNRHHHHRHRRRRHHHRHRSLAPLHLRHRRHRRHRVPHIHPRYPARHPARHQCAHPTYHRHPLRTSVTSTSIATSWTPHAPGTLCGRPATVEAASTPQHHPLTLLTLLLLTPTSTPYYLSRISLHVLRSGTRRWILLLRNSDVLRVASSVHSIPKLLLQALECYMCPPRT